MNLSDKKEKDCYIHRTVFTENDDEFQCLTNRTFLSRSINILYVFFLIIYYRWSFPCALSPYSRQIMSIKV
jgi:hypothetical protein